MAASRPSVLNSVGDVAAVRGVVQQGRGWPHRLTATGMTAPAGLTSRLDPAEVTERGFEGAAGPLRGRGVLAVQEWAAQCHGADTGLVAPALHSGGDGLPPGSWRNSVGA